MRNKIVETTVTHPLAVKVMQELDGLPVKIVHSHHESNAPSSAIYKVEFIPKDDE